MTIKFNFCPCPCKLHEALKTTAHINIQQLYTRAHVITLFWCNVTITWRGALNFLPWAVYDAQRRKIQKNRPVPLIPADYGEQRGCARARVLTVMSFSRLPNSAAVLEGCVRFFGRFNVLQWHSAKSGDSSVIKLPVADIKTTCTTSKGITFQTLRTHKK